MSPNDTKLSLFNLISFFFDSPINSFFTSTGLISYLDSANFPSVLVTSSDFGSILTSAWLGSIFVRVTNYLSCGFVSVLTTIGTVEACSYNF